MKNNSYERAHSARHNFQIMLLLLSIIRHLWLGEPKWKYGLGTQSSSSCQMQVVCFLDFFLESKSCIPALGFCAGVRHLMQFRELQGKNLPTETFQYVLLSKSENLGSKWRNHKPQSGWLFWNALQWMGCSSGSGMKPGTGLELVSWEVMALGVTWLCFAVSSAEHFFIL